MNEILIDLVRQGPLFDKTINQFLWLGLEQIQIALGRRILQVGQQSLSPVFNQFV